MTTETTEQPAVAVAPGEKHFPMRLTLYCIAHFLIDLASTMIVLGYIWGVHKDTAAFIGFYAIAFAGQMPLGLLADKLNRNGLVAAAGCVSMIAATALMLLPGDPMFYAVVILGGLGNALVHIGGGIDVMNHSGPKSGPLGIFVSPGAIGLFLGGILVKHNIQIPIISIALLSCTAIALPWAHKYSLNGMVSRNEPLSLRLSLNSTKLWAAAAITALFIVVCMRSLVGFMLSFEWKSEFHWGLALLLALVCGKAFGGVLSDRFGMRRTAIASLSAAAVCFLFPTVPVAGVFAVFLFNMTMPMTLWALSRIFDHAKGFAFGTLTLSLFLGFCLNVLFPAPFIPAGWGFSLASLLSLALLLIGLKPLSHV